MALTSSVRGTERKMTMRPTGTIIAPPTPCRKRAATKAGSESEKAQQIDPSMKMQMAERKTVREPKRSATQPQTGMNTPSPTT